MYGHVINVPTHFNVKLPAIGGHLPNADADSHLLVVPTCYNGQFKQMPRFRRSFQPKIARGGHPNLRPTFCSNVHAAIWWPQAIFHIESKWHHVVKVTYSMLNPRCWRRERFLVFTNAHHVERLPSSWCVKMQIARIFKQTEWPQRAIVAERYSGSRPDMKYFERQKLTYVDYKCSPTVPYVSCYIIMMH